MLRLSGHIPITENQISPLEQIIHQCLRTSNYFLNFVPGADWGMKCIKKGPVSWRRRYPCSCTSLQALLHWKTARLFSCPCRTSCLKLPSCMWSSHSPEEVPCLPPDSEPVSPGVLLVFNVAHSKIYSVADSCRCMAKPIQYCKVINLQLK